MIAGMTSAAPRDPASVDPTPAPVLVLVPVGWAGPAGEGQGELIEYQGWREAVSRLRADPRPAVLWSDRLSQSDLPTVAAAVRLRQAPVIEVRAARWDGETPSSLSAACRGVISGFAEAGIGAAVRLAATG